MTLVSSVSTAVVLDSSLLDVCYSRQQSQEAMTLRDWSLPVGLVDSLVTLVSDSRLLVGCFNRQ